MATQTRTAPSLSDIPPQQWRNGVLEVIDAIAVRNHGKGEIIEIRREDFDNLMLLRGTPDEVLGRHHQREHNARPHNVTRNRR